MAEVETAIETAGPHQNSLMMGSFILEGELHRKLSLGCQDACQTVDSGNVKVAVVCDGCSTTDRGFTQNQVGAILGAQYIGTSLANRLQDSGELDDKHFEMALRKTADQAYKFFRQLCRRMGLVFPSTEWADFVYNKLMFTIIGFAAVGDKYWIFGAGDGCYGVGDAVEVLDPAETVYLNKSLLDGEDKKKSGIETYHKGNISGSPHIWVSSDGLSSALLSPSSRNEFREFLFDDLAGERDRLGNDTTIQAFRRTFYRNHRVRLSDDIAFALLKHDRSQAHWQASANEMEKY